MTQLLGFVPDVDPSTPGAITACANVVPSANGMRGAPLPVAISDVPALAAACRNAAVCTLLDDSRRIFAGTETKLYELSGGAWVDVSRVGDYALGVEDRWDILQYGDASLAANKSATIQRSNGSGDFADIAGAPKAKIIESAASFVIAFDTDDASYGDSPDRWWCSALNDDTSWTPSLSTQATTGRLVSTPGRITAAKAFGDQVVAYKDRSMYLGRYVGSPAVWEFDLIPGDVGCVGVDAVCDVGGLGQFFMGRSDVLFFDGTRPVSIAEGMVRQWLFSNCSHSFLYRSKLVHDKQNGVIWLFYPSANSTGTCDAAMVYHIGRRQWGSVSMEVEASLNFVTAGATFDSLIDYAATMSGLPDIPSDSQYWLNGGRLMVVFTTAHQMSALSGSTAASSMTLFEVGDDEAVTRMSRLRVGYQLAPTSATAEGSAKMSRGESYTVASSGTYASGKTDLNQSGRFHRVQVDAVGDWAAAVVDFDLKTAGNR
jgi:hypothetical protein